MIEGEITLIIWHDTAHYPGWYGSQDELPKCGVRMQSVGWKIYQDYEVVIIATTYSEFKAGDLLVIPIQCIETIEPLELPPGV